jgi:hypothetical protein
MTIIISDKDKIYASFPHMRICVAIISRTYVCTETHGILETAIWCRIYLIYMRYNIIIAALLLLLGIAGVGTTNQVLAWNGDGCCGPHWGVGDYQQPGSGPEAYQNGWYAGQQDAIYDHTNNLQYNPQGQCLPCHSELYWNGFHEGYDKQWNNYQSTSQSTNVYINNSPGAYVNTDQNSGLDSSPPPLGQAFCGSLGCGDPGGSGGPGSDP